jgi:hypothetical protein
MDALAPAAQLMEGYEALRAQATGHLAPVTPRGLTLLLTYGLPAWMAAWAAPPSPVPAVAPPVAPPPTGGRAPALAGLGAAELVGVMSEMVLGGRGRGEA